MYASASAIIKELAEIVRPPRRLTVPEAAERYVMLDVPGGYSGPFKNDLVYYLVEPAECLTQRNVKAVIFVAPAQTAKTSMLVDNWFAHTITCDPSDHLIVQTAQDTARDYSKRRVDRLISASPELKKRLKAGGQADNTYDKFFKSGMILSLAWPTKNQLAGKAIGKMALTDYDRMPPDIDGDGPAFNLAQKRTTTFLSRGMTLAESSPSRPIIDPKYKPKTLHEAPPTTGILGLYNTGDKRRIYGKCPSCLNYFSPAADIESAFFIPENKAKTDCGLICTCCGYIISLNEEKQYKKTGVWMKDGQTIDKQGVIHGDVAHNSIASFWLPGWFAAFQSWQSILDNYLSALDHYERTGDEEPLKATYNLDQGAPYLSKALQNTRSPEELEARAEKVEKRTVPDGVKFLLAAIDVQKNRFVVQVEGFGDHLESWIIDRFNLRLSYRDDESGNSKPIDPGSYAEDWDTLIPNVLQKTYPLANGEGELPILLTACDSGGAEGVTNNAYSFWRRLSIKGLVNRDFRRSRFVLIKGASSMSSPLIRETFPDTTRRTNRKILAVGDVPVYLLNSNLFKDIVSNDCERGDVGPRFVHFPQWLGAWFFNELTAETRTAKGWVNKSRRANEGFDLMCYTRALIKLLKAEQIDWSKPPAWADLINYKLKKENKEDERLKAIKAKQQNYTQQMLSQQRKREMRLHGQSRGNFVNAWKGKQ